MGTLGQSYTGSIERSGSVGGIFSHIARPVLDVPRGIVSG